jgi:membrane-bound lytic murein transglycosylase D
MGFLPRRLTCVAGLLALAGLLPVFAAAEDQITVASLNASVEPDADDGPSIISIDSAPDTIEPLLKAIDQQGDPQRDLWERVRVGFGLGELDTYLVAENEAWYAERPEYVARMLERSKRYLFYIVQEVEKRGMPTEIALLPMIESAFNPQARSRANAVGMWQFMPSTGRTFGLEQNWWVDERRDILAATDAALNYLQKLYGMFGDWHLALAAYNWGEGSVSRAIAKNEAKGLPTDYLNLRMPVETANYVPRLLAVKHLLQRPQDFNAKLGVLPNSPYFAQITITRHIDVALAAKLAETPLQEFTSLNPHYMRPIINAKEPTTLLLPVDKAEIFARNLEDHPTPLVSWKPYQGKRGERLDSIASRSGISTARLKEVNGISSKNRRLASNQLLLVPGAAQAESLDRTRFTEIKADAGPAPTRSVYVVQRGDTLASIARSHGLSMAQIKSWNGIKTAKLAPKQKLILSAPGEGNTKLAAHSEKPLDAKARKSGDKAGKTAAAKREPKQTSYTVRRGDTLYSIAQRFDVDLDDLRRWNGISSKNHLQPGDRLTIQLAKAG